MMISHDATPATAADMTSGEAVERPDLEALISAHRKAKADCDALLKVMRGSRHRAKHDALEKFFNAQVDMEDRFLREIFAHPCRSLAEVQRKAAYLLSDPGFFDCVDADMTRDLVRSLAP